MHQAGPPSAGPPHVCSGNNDVLWHHIFDVTERLRRAHETNAQHARDAFDLKKQLEAARDRGLIFARRWERASTLLAVYRSCFGALPEDVEVSDVGEDEDVEARTDPLPVPIREGGADGIAVQPDGGPVP